jgi:RHS repeat-associated protein
MTTGGTESFTYDARGLKQTYRNPSNASGNPTARYRHDAYDRVSDVTDVLGGSLGDPNHTTSLTYNLRGQPLVTTLPKDPVDNVRHTITNTYNADGTLSARLNELNQPTSYTYDDYRRVKSVTTPDRYAGDPTNHTTNVYYYDAGLNDDYRHADAQPSWVLLPSGEAIKTTYNENRRKTAVTVGYWSADAATTSYGYDNAGNVTSVKAPKQQPGQPYATRSTTTVYDQRNRPSSVIDGGNYTTIFTYDLAGRKKSVTRPNNQVITYDDYDAMNRLLQQTVKQTPNPDAVTQYTYYTPADGANAPVGLLKTMKDPRLFNSGEAYIHSYDSMGRKWDVTYPLDSAIPPARRVESFRYDNAGRLQTFKNRNDKTQTFAYDALHRVTGFSWNDGGITPSVTFGYDIGSRLITINNANATISRQYYDDDLLRVETEQIINGPLSQLVYTYDADGNRASAIIWPSNASFDYLYTGRNQLKNIVDNVSGATLATYGYDPNGNLESRALNNSTSTTYAYDALDRVTWVTHALNGTTRRFTYGYDNVGNRKWAQRDLGNGDVFGYDFNDQVIAVRLNTANPDTASVGAPTILYDANGNRTSFSAYGPTQTYSINNLNQYTARTNSTSPLYDPTGNMTRGMDNSAYTYDAQNRLLTANTAQFKYDALNRQVSRTVGGATTYSAWDGWDLMQEYQGVQGSTITARYVHGATGLVKNQLTNNYYYQDGSGSTSHLANSTGALLEWYRYDLHGTPMVNGQPGNTQSAFGVRHLFTGQQWYSELGLYDLRNRFYSPDIGRFLQSDPIGFAGDPTNLYRYCGNNPVTRSDPSGLWIFARRQLQIGNPNEATAEPVFVTGTFDDALDNLPDFVGNIGGDLSSGRGLSPLDQWGGMPGEGGFGDGGRGGGSGLFDPLPVNPFTPPNPLGQNPFAPATAFTLTPPLPSSFTQLTIGFSWPLPYVGTLFGVQWSRATTPFGQTFYGFGPQVGRAPTVLSVSVTVNPLTSHVGTGAAGMTQALTGWSWNAGYGRWGGGGQWSWGFSSWPWETTSWGGGFFTPQAGVALMYGWPAATPVPSPGGY